MTQEPRPIVDSLSLGFLLPADDSVCRLYLNTVGLSYQLTRAVVQDWFGKARYKCSVVLYCRPIVGLFCVVYSICEIYITSIALLHRSCAPIATDSKKIRLSFSNKEL